MAKSASTSKEPRKQHSPEFRLEALKLRIGVATAARELGPYESQLYHWRSKQQQLLTSSKRENKLATENTRLKRQLAEQAVVIDLWSQAVIGCSMSSPMTAQLACDSLEMVLWRRKRPKQIIVHTDRGSQYCSGDYQALLGRHHLQGSMSAKGCCYDNACVDNFFTR